MNDAAKPVVLVLAALPKDLQDRLADRYRLVTAYKDFIAAVTASGLAAEAQAMVTMGGHGANPELLSLLPKLGLVCSFGAGYERADVAALKERGIRLTNAAGGNAPCVADMAMTLLLAATLRLLPADRLARSGEWSRVPPKGWTPTAGFGGRKLGIFGLGAIGLNVARRAAAFDLEIGYHNRRPRPDVDYRYFDDVTAMAQWCDYLLVACPLTDATHHAVNAGVLKALGADGVLVNVGRGAVVDQGALIEALRDGTIAAAGLDVLEGEPEVPVALREAPNVVLTPHIGAVTRRAVASLEELLLDNLAAFFADKPLLTPVAL